MSSRSSALHHTTRASIPYLADELTRLFDDGSSSRRESGLSGTFPPQNIACAAEQASSVPDFHWRGRTPPVQATGPEADCFVAADCQWMSDLPLHSTPTTAKRPWHAETTPRSGKPGAETSISSTGTCG